MAKIHPKKSQLLDPLDALVNRSDVGREVGSAGVRGVAGLASVGLFTRVHVHMVVQGSLVMEAPNRGADRTNIWLLKIDRRQNVYNSKLRTEGVGGCRGEDSVTEMSEIQK